MTKDYLSYARVWIAFLLLSLVWGSSYLFIRVGLEQLSPLAVVALRLISGAATLWLIVGLIHQDLRISRRKLVLLAILANTNTVIPFLLITWGELAVPSGLTAVMNSTTPIFSLLIAAVALQDEPITLPRLGGVAIGFGGVLLLVSRDLGHGSVNWYTLASEGAIVLAGACYALSAVMARRTMKGVPPLVIAVYAVSIATFETTVLSLIFSPPPIGSLHPKILFAILWLGVLGSALAYLLYYFIIDNWGASRATLVTYAIPAVGLTLGAIFLGETLDWRIVGGSVLVICGVGLASLVRRKRDTTPSGMSESMTPSRKPSAGN